MDSPALGRNKKNISWTPLMDEYFINLMVKEVHRGTKVENAFAKHAWSHMERLFQQKFGPLYNKDCMKNRLRTLKKQHSIIKALCERSGIVWDHEPQMVVVSDEAAWDAYIKDHPEALKYRDRCVPYYEDLCLIFSPGPADEEVNVVGGLSGPKGLISEEVMEAATDMQSSPLSDGQDYLLDDAQESPSPKSGTGGAESAVMNGHLRNKMCWTQLMDLYFISLMVEEVHLGTKLDDSFHKHGWNRLEREFQKRFGNHFNKEMMEDRLEILRKQYNVIKTLCEQKGFAWNHETQMIIASDDSLWDDYTKVHPEACQYKGKALPYFEDLCAIFSSKVPGGRRSSVVRANFHSKEIVLAMQAVRAAADPLSSPITPGHEHLANGIHDSSESSEDKHIPNKRRKHLPRTQPSLAFSGKSQAVARGDVVKALQQMAAAVNDLANAFREAKNSQLVERYISALGDIPGMDQDLFLAACDLLEDERKARTFLALNMELRKRWLMKKLRPF